LELLLELQALGDTVVLAWPEGENCVSSTKQTQRFPVVNSTPARLVCCHWLKLDKDLVLDMQQLLELLDKTPSRFIPLGDGQFGFNPSVSQRLDELRAFSK